ncbi:MAG: hypothetical protein HY811_02960 [Planctomycetes bacterium]|nr:hypothetical protein [Planctomycetota bacterium]
MDNEKETPLGGCLLRVFWILVGPAALFISAIFIGIYQAAFPGPFDIFYGVVLMLTVAARIADKPQPDAPEPERRAVKLYVTVLPIAAIALWLIAHFGLKKVVLI